MGLATPGFFVVWLDLRKGLGSPGFLFMWLGLLKSLGTYGIFWSCLYFTMPLAFLSVYMQMYLLCACESVSALHNFMADYRAIIETFEIYGRLIVVL